MSSLAARLTGQLRAPRERLVPRLALASTVLLTLGITTSLQAAPWVVITEIHYHPPGDPDEAARQEFIEILGLEAPRASLEGWRLEGDIKLNFPPTAQLLPGERLVLARDPEALVRQHPGVGRVLGPFEGALDNKSGRLRIRNSAGAVVCSARWGTGERWPAAPDGTGHTLSLLDPLLDPADPASWAASRELGGTPGEENFPALEPPGRALIERGATWRLWKGLAPPPAGWRAPELRDDAWEEAPGGFGYGDEDDRTVLDDMRGGYISLFTRKSFEAPPPAGGEVLVLRVDYDDGFVAYLNGREVARRNLGAVGTEVAHDQAADRSHEAGLPEEIELGPVSGALRQGRNVLSVEVHNDELSSSDLSLAVELLARPPGAADATPPPPRLNEVFGGKDPFVEVFNPGDSPLNLAGWWISDEPGNLKKFRVSGSPVAPPRGWIALTRKELGEKLELRGSGLVLLCGPEGEAVVDALRWPGKKTGASGEGAPATEPAGFGRSPDGGTDLRRLESPTPGKANPVDPPGDLVLNEIFYHSPSGNADEQYIEITNRGRDVRSLAGFQLTGGIRFEFPAGASLRPGGFLVVARNPGALASRYGLSRDAVLGPFTGKLSSRSDEIVLRNVAGDVVDRVEYADRSPWPRAADGQGSSLELIHPSLDRSIAQAWAASDESKKSKWQTFTYTRRHRDFEGRSFSELQFLLLDEGACLIDEVTLSGNLLKETFEKGAPEWTARGTHEASGPATVETPQGKSAYRLVAEGRGNTRENYVARPLGTELQPGQQYSVRFRARWLQGSPRLLSRTPGQGLALLHELQIPERLGTPGAANSRAQKSPPAVIGAPIQSPIAPTPRESVTLQVPISAVGPVESPRVLHAAEGSGATGEAPLRDDGQGPDRIAGDGIWSAAIPPLPAGIVTFRIEASAGGLTGSYPPGAAGRHAVYGVGLQVQGKHPTLHVLASRESWSSLESRPRMSNLPIDGSLVYGDLRIFHDVKIRRRGSPFTRSQRNWRIIFGAKTLDGRGTLTLDGQGGSGARPNERLTFWLVDQLHAPNSRQRYVRAHIGSEDGLYEDVEKVDAGYCERWFPRESGPEDRGDAPGKKSQKGTGQPAATGRKVRPGSPAVGLLHKVDDYWELTSEGEQIYREADFNYTENDVEAYRWNFPPRGASFDLEPLLHLVKLLDPRATPDRAFDLAAETTIDADEWTRVLAARTLADDWDTMGRRRGKNAFLYLPPGETAWRLIPWDCDLSWGQDSSAPLQTGRFAGIERLLDRPVNQKRYHAYLAYLAEHALAKERFDVVLADLRARTGADLSQLGEFAAERARHVSRQIEPGPPLRVQSSLRVEQKEPHDLARLSGEAPTRALRFRLAGREGTVRWVDEQRWTAEIPLGPEGGELALEALDFGGHAVATAFVKIRERASARALPPLPAVAREVSGTGKGRVRAQAPRGVATEEPTLPRPPDAEPRSPASPERTAAPAAVVARSSDPARGTPAPRGEAAGEAEPARPGAPPEAGASPPGPAPAPGALSRPPSVGPAEDTGSSTEHAQAREIRRPASGEEDQSSAGPLEGRGSAWWWAALPGGAGLGLLILAFGFRRRGPRAQASLDGEPAPARKAPGPTQAPGPTRARGPTQTPVPTRARGPTQAPGPTQTPGPTRARGPTQAPGPTRARGPLPVAREEAPGALPPGEPSAGPATLPGEAWIVALGGDSFELAERAVASLGEAGEVAVPALLRALGDSRATRFAKVRRGPRGLSVVRAEAPSAILVRHVAGALLERLLGPPPVPRPSAADWETWWKERDRG